MLKKLLRVLLIVVAVLALAFVGLVFLVNPNQYKSAIEDAVLARTGYQLNIAGNLDLTFSPYIGISLNDVRLRNPASPQELASTSLVSLRVDPGSLLTGNLSIREFRADDFHVNWFTDAEGTSIWQVEELASNYAATSTSTTATTTDTGGGISASFEHVSIANASVDIQDVSAGSRYSLNNLNLESSGSNIEGRPFDIDVDFNFLNNGMTKPMTMGLRSSIVADLDAGKIAINDIDFNITPMLLQGQITVSDLNDNMTFEGTMNSNSFDVVGLLETLGLSEADEEFDATAIGANTDAQQLAFEVDFTGDQSQLVVPSFSGTLGPTEIEADASVRFATDFTPTNVSYDIITSAIDISPFMSEDESAAADEATEGDESTSSFVATSTPANQADSELPVELLSSMNVLGSISIESITANDFYFEDINVFTNIEDGVLDIEIQPISAFEGSMQGNIRLDGRASDAVLTTQLSINQLNIVDLAPSISRLNSVTGKLNVEVDYAAEGSTTSSLLNSLSGSTTFEITENSVDIGVIKQVFTAIAALSPTGEAIQQWPDVIQFGELAGYIILQDGIGQNQQVRLRMDNIDISGTGGIDFNAGSFDYDLAFAILGPPEVQTIPINELYHNVSWPVDCNAAFADEVSRYCRPDFTRVREIFGQIGSNAARSFLQEEITDQVPEELQDAARGLLRSIFN